VRNSGRCAAVRGLAFGQREHPLTRNRVRRNRAHIHVGAVEAVQGLRSRRRRGMKIARLGLAQGDAEIGDFFRPEPAVEVRLVRP